MGSVAEGRACVAVDDPRGRSLRGNPGAAAGSEPGGRLGPTRLQPREVRDSQHAAARQGEASLRVVAADRGGRREPQSGIRADVVFVAATGLRPSELFGLGPRDVDREAGVVYVRRAYANGRLKHTKTRLSNRVPLQAKIDFRSFGRRHWKPAQRAAGIELLRDLYDLRHSYAIFACAPAFRSSRGRGSWARASP